MEESGTTMTASGMRVEYRCIAAKYRIVECPAAVYLLYRAYSFRVSLHRTECAHANHVTDPTRSLSTELKDFVRQKFAEGIT